MSLAADAEDCFYEEKRFFDGNGNPIHWQPSRRAQGKGKQKGDKGGKGKQKGDKGGKGWVTEPARPPRHAPAPAPAPAPAHAPAPAPGPTALQRMAGPAAHPVANAHIVAALTGAVPEAPLHLGTIVEAPFLCIQLCSLTL